jgi:hypothetical protein
VARWRASETEPGEGWQPSRSRCVADTMCQRSPRKHGCQRPPLTRSQLLAQHPLPQGERERSFPPSPRAPSPRRRGEVNRASTPHANSLLRRDPRPSCAHHDEERRLLGSPPATKKGTERRQAHPTMTVPAKHGSGLAKPARLSALRSGTRRNITFRLSLGPCLLRRGRNAHEGAFASGHSAVAAPHARVVLPEGIAVCLAQTAYTCLRCPKPPGSGVTSLARRNRTRSISRLSPVTPFKSEIRIDM